MITTVLWDVDGTLLNFQEAEKASIFACFEHFGLGDCTQEMLSRYSAINTRYWKQLELGELEKSQVLTGRFEDFFKTEGINFSDYSAFNQEYQLRLGDTICFNDNAYELIRELKSTVKQYAVTNGTFTAQQRKLTKSGLITLFDGCFISDQIGYEKPDLRFFQHVFEQIGPVNKEEILIVGDSLTGDIKGGNNAQIKCCWYNPQNLTPPDSLKIHYQIKNLWEIKEIIETI